MRNTLEFAKSELNKYLNLMGLNKKPEIDIVCDIGKLKNIFNGNSCILENWDDGFIIDVSSFEGSITGTNPRSVLLGVYEYLTYLGCRFLKPGEEGEYIPEIDNDRTDCRLMKKADYRHRGICIEGAVSLEHVLNMIDWAPKMGFNSYFIQFFEGHTFFERWYRHTGNEVLKPVEYTRENSALFFRQIVDEIKKRDMILHAVGHGWTCESMGYPSVGWDVVDNNKIPDETRKHLALIKNKREFFEGIPLNTNLCYSQEVVKDSLLKQIVSYLKTHNEVDVLHIWLADNFNNFCECEDCMELTPADHYVEILNEIDRKLTEYNIQTKIAFLIYYELLWTPKTKRIINKDRFIMMFAPITRTYTKPYLENGDAPDIQNLEPVKFEHNKIKCPSDIESNLKFLFNWQELFEGDSFAFDYHMMWDLYRDYSNMALSKILHKDIKALKKLGLNGNISCQVQRSFFPNGICMYIMGRTLFDSSLSYSQITEDYFISAYGQCSDIAKEYLDKISLLVPHKYMRYEIPMTDKNTAANFEKGITLVREYRKIFQNNIGSLTHSRKKMLEILIASTEIFEELFLLFKMKACGVPKDDIMDLWNILAKKLDSREMQLSDVVDIYYFKMISKGLLEHVW